MSSQTCCFHVTICSFAFCRGNDFRKKFSKLGDLRGFFPTKLNFMALTATASEKTRKEVIRLLGMVRPFVIVKSPDKPNIVYHVYEKEKELEDLFAPHRCLKSLYFVEHTTAAIFSYTSRTGLGRRSPILLDIQVYLDSEYIVDMFTACNTTGVKASILSSFCANHSRLRLVIATVAFGMGIDCPNVQRMIHWSSPSDVEMYIQEMGRAGRDGATAFATLFYSRKDISMTFIDESIVQYCENSDHCRRIVLF